MRLLGEDTLDIDIHSTTAFIAESLFKVLYAVPTFKVVRISNSERQRLHTKARVNSLPSSTRSTENELAKNLIRGLSRNHELTCVEFDSVTPCIAKRIPAIVKGSLKTLKSIFIRNVVLDSGLLSRIMQQLISSEITHWHFINCGLNESSASHFSDVISNHNIRRDVAKWQYRLRDNDGMPGMSTLGVLSVDLQDNRLGDIGVKCLIEALTDDKWVLDINLSSNQLTNVAICALIEMLQINQSLCSITIDDNPGLDVALVAHLKSILVNRQDSKHGDPLMAKWATAKVPSNVQVRPSAWAQARAAPVHEHSSTKTVIIPSPQITTPDLTHDFQEFLSSFGFSDIADLTKTIKRNKREISTKNHSINELGKENTHLKLQIQQLRSSKPYFRRKIRSRTVKAAQKKSKLKPDLINEDDVHQIGQLVTAFDSLFQRLHMYMDELENSENKEGNMQSDTAANFAFLSSQVKKSCDFFERIIAKIEQPST
uniref:Uncharacterized protein n=1 Tax=Spongospora subterranea TaxID=70186 RepID=A0A0H5QHQ6_9EUKA|eukprot:CRZ00846.1 hypothetical protein [Spongospora subterranea]